jgi:hypothetical protein
MRGDVTPHNLALITSWTLSSHFKFRLIYLRGTFSLSFRKDCWRRLTPDKPLRLIGNYICYLGNNLHSCILSSQYAGCLRFLRWLYASLLILELSVNFKVHYIRSVRLSQSLSPNFEHLAFREPIKHFYKIWDSNILGRLLQLLKFSKIQAIIKKTYQRIYFIFHRGFVSFKSGSFSDLFLG